MTERRKSVLFLIAAAILWSTGGFLIKLIQWNPMAIAGIRSLIAAIFLLACIRKPHWTWSSAQIWGAVAYASMVILFVTANKMTTATNVILLQYGAPIYIALLSNWFLKEKITRFDWLIIAVVMVGMVLFFLDGLSLAGFTGNVLAILAGIGLAWFFLLSRKQKTESPVESVILGNLLAVVITLPFWFDGNAPDIVGWGALVLLGIFQLGLPYLLFSVAIKHVTALEAILIPIIEPLLNPLWVFLITRERPGIWALVGGVIVLVAITIRGIRHMSPQRDVAFPID